MFPPSLHGGVNSGNSSQSKRAIAKVNCETSVLCATRGSVLNSLHHDLTADLQNEFSSNGGKLGRKWHRSCTVLELSVQKTHCKVAETVLVLAMEYSHNWDFSTLFHYKSEPSPHSRLRRCRPPPAAPSQPDAPSEPTLLTLRNPTWLVTLSTSRGHQPHFSTTHPP